jgi:hypothetical protein
MSTKSKASHTVQHFAVFVLRWFEHRVKVFHTDNERSLDKDSMAWIAHIGIALELPATYTHAHDGAAECSGGSHRQGLSLSHLCQPTRVTDA